MSETRQRWRLVVAREEAARDLVQREVGEAWEEALRRSGLPLSTTETASPRLRLAFGPPVPVGMLAEREPIDVGLTDRRRIDVVRAAIEAVIPSGYRLVDLYDVWPGAPTLSASIVAGDYRAAVTVDRAVAVGGAGLTPDPEEAVAGLLAEPRIACRREKAGASVEVDIRPLILALRVEEPCGGPAREPAEDAGSFDLLMRLRLGGDGGVGRPEEVIAALGERLERTLSVRRISRERVILIDGPA